MSLDSSKLLCLELVDAIQSTRDKGQDVDSYTIDTLFTMAAWIATQCKEDLWGWVHDYLGPLWYINPAKVLCFEISKFSVGVRERNKQTYNDIPCLYRPFCSVHGPDSNDYAQFEHTNEYCALMNILVEKFSKFGVTVDVQ